MSPKECINVSKMYELLGAGMGRPLISYIQDWRDINKDVQSEPGRRCIRHRDNVLNNISQAAEPNLQTSKYSLTYLLPPDTASSVWSAFHAFAFQLTQDLQPSANLSYRYCLSVQLMPPGTYNDPRMEFLFTHGTSHC